MEEPEIRLAKTESLFRDVNERIAESAQRFDAEDAAFVCECADADRIVAAQVRKLDPRTGTA
jgi:hypothetical protein